MISLAESTRGRIRHEDLEHYDEPGPEDAAELDERTWMHLDAIVFENRDLRCPLAVIGRAGYGSWLGADDDEDEDEDADDFGELEDDDEEDDDEDDRGDDRDGDEGPTPILPGTPADVGLSASARPLSGVLDQLALRFDGMPAALREPSRARVSARRDRSRPGGSPGWKGDHGA